MPVEASMRPEYLALLIPFGFFATVALITYFVLDFRRRREAQRVEFHSRLLERIGSVQELTQLLGNEAGERLLDSLTPQADLPQQRILAAVRYGIVLLVAAVTLFVAIGAGAFPSEAEDLSVVATFGVGIGGGLLLAAMASYMLGKRMGLLKNNHQKRASKVPPSA
jgi:hypothetical protein